MVMIMVVAGKGTVVAEGKIVGMLMENTVGERWGDAGATWDDLGGKREGGVMVVVLGGGMTRVAGE